MKFYKELHELGLKYHTDKSTVHIHKGISFMQFYETYLRDRRAEKLNILEIGILRGASLRAIRDYMMFSNIVGLDIDPNTRILNEPRIETYIGSQDDNKIKEDIQKKYPTFDIILDDGSHVNELSFKTFDLYWPMLNDNGVYILEDTHCMSLDLSESSKSWPGMAYNRKDIDLNNKLEDYQKFILDLLLNIQGAHNNIPNILTFHVFSETLVILKKI